MKSIVISPKNQTEFKFINQLLQKLGLSIAAVPKEEIEDIGLSKILLTIEKNKKVNNETVLKKLR